MENNPSADIKVPKEVISVCEEFELEIHNIQFNGYRNLENIIWSLQAMTPSDSSYFAAINAYLTEL